MIGATSYLLLTWLLTCPLGSLQDDAERRVGGSRFDVTKIVGEKPVGRPGEYPGFMENVNPADVSNALYVHLDDEGIQGYSVRLSDKVMLSPKGRENSKLKLGHVQDLPKSFDPTDLEICRKTYRKRTMDLFKECSEDAWLYIERFQYNFTFPGPWHPEDLKVVAQNWKPSCCNTCMLYAYRRISDNFVTLSNLKVNVVCGEVGPLCEVRPADKLKGQDEFGFCPNDNGAPVFCGGKLALTLYAGEHKYCHNVSLASRLNNIRGALEETFRKVHDPRTVLE